MKESHGEGLATHTGPESCGASRKGGVEALTGVRAGQDIEPRKFAYSGMPTLSCYAEGNNRCTDKARCIGISRGQRDPVHVRKHLVREPGDPAFTQGRRTPGDASGSLRTHDDDERTREVGQTHTTREVPEQG